MGKGGGSKKPTQTQLAKRAARKTTRVAARSGIKLKPSDLTSKTALQAAIEKVEAARGEKVAGRLQGYSNTMSKASSPAQRKKVATAARKTSRVVARKQGKKS